MDNRVTEVQNVVSRYIEEHCDNLGPELTSKAVKNAVDGKSPAEFLASERTSSSHGVNMDLMFVLEIVFKTAAFASTCLTIYEKTEKLGKKPTTEEITAEAQNSPEAFAVKKPSEIAQAVVAYKNQSPPKW